MNAGSGRRQLHAQAVTPVAAARQQPIQHPGHGQARPCPDQGEQITLARAGKPVANGCTEHQQHGGQPVTGERRAERRAIGNGDQHAVTDLHRY
ncbi:hypothetical protein RZS08_04730, partial [Arthrospira platensis SPKY1]|nr:hypothetical protein [Arthrospira platensis SPKY1]